MAYNTTSSHNWHCKWVKRIPFFSKVWKCWSTASFPNFLVNAVASNSRLASKKRGHSHFPILINVSSTQQIAKINIDPQKFKPTKIINKGLSKKFKPSKLNTLTVAGRVGHDMCVMYLYVKRNVVQVPHELNSLRRKMRNAYFNSTKYCV